MGDESTTLKTPLHERHVALGARMVPFAGYDMPVQYKPGIIAEHNWTREKAGLFDVSHMGQALLIADDGSHHTAAAFLETLTPADILGLPYGMQRYTQFLNEDGGILDDLMVTRSYSADDDGTLMLVVNAARKAVDFAHIEKHLPSGVRLEPMPERALLALQGPAAAAVLEGRCAAANELSFMQASSSGVYGIDCHISRSGYTGEDGYEISVAASRAGDLWDKLVIDERVMPVGLGARDSLRLEAGLCLYGHDIDETTSPVEAGLVWSIGKRRREEGGFPGFARISRELREGARRKRVGIRPEGRAPAREGTAIIAGGRESGVVTSGGFGPTAGGPVAMGYVAAADAAPGTALELMVRGEPRPASVVRLPFVPHSYAR
ncbi:MAG: glycine cleavage system aminomethyltransferase GcvT [Flavobacteriaceae bacterium]